MSKFPEPGSQPFDFNQCRSTRVDFYASFRDHSCSAPVHCLRDEVTAIEPCTRDGNKYVAGTHTAGIRDQMAHFDAFGIKRGKNGTWFAHIPSFTTSILAICSGLSGASVATPSVRNAPAMISANAGAATSPP